MYSSTTEYQRASLTILPTINYNLPFIGHKIPYLSSLLVTCNQSSRLYGVVSILHGVDPSSISFNVAAMRRHLLQGLENKKITVFPHRKLSFVKKPVLKVTGIPIFCTCRMPEHGFMFTCTECKKWFHPSCLITQTQRQIRSSKIIKCLDCRS